MAALRFEWYIELNLGSQQVFLGNTWGKSDLQINTSSVHRLKFSCSQFPQFPFFDWQKNSWEWNKRSKKCYCKRTHYKVISFFQKGRITSKTLSIQTSTHCIPLFPEKVKSNLIPSTATCFTEDGASGTVLHPQSLPGTLCSRDNRGGKSSSPSHLSSKDSLLPHSTAENLLQTSPYTVALCPPTTNQAVTYFSDVTHCVTYLTMYNDTEPQHPGFLASADNDIQRRN